MCNNSLLATDYIEKIFSRKSKQTSAMKPEVYIDVGGIKCRHLPNIAGTIAEWL